MGTREQQERRRGNRAANRHERLKEQHSGGREWDCIKLPEGLEVFKPEAKAVYHIDVIPYIVGKYNKKADEGDEFYELSYPIYNGIGIDEKKYIAIGEMLGKRDPVAEHFADLRKQGMEWDEMKMFKPKWRQLMLVFVHEQADKGLQIFEGAYGTFGEQVAEAILAEETDYIDNFDDPDHGATIKVRFKSKNIGTKNPWVLAGDPQFIEREDGFTANGDPKAAAKILKQASDICLDDCLKFPTYETLKAALDGVPLNASDDEDEDEPAPKPKAKPKAAPAPADEDEDEEDEDEPAPKPKAKAAPVDEDEGDEDEDEDEDDEPAPKPKAKAKPKAAPVDDWDDEDEDEPAPKPKAKAKPKAAPAPVDEDEGDEDEDEDEDEDDEPAPKPKPKAKAKAAPVDEDDEPAPKPKAKAKAKAAPVDDWDDDWDDAPKAKGKKGQDQLPF